MKPRLILAMLALPLTAVATEPPRRTGEKLPDAYYERIKAQPDAFTFAHAYYLLADQIQRNRLTLRTSADYAAALASVSINGGTAIRGHKTIPVILIQTAGSSAAPYTPAALNQHLFQGPSPTETLTEFYKAMSYNHLNLSGYISSWTAVPKRQNDYAGKDYRDPSKPPGTPLSHCYGLCTGAHVGDLIKEALDRTPGIDWSKYDNDGPDDVANSSDDDGYVDFVAFVHPGIGGECGGPGNTNIWSHRGQLRWESTGEYTTKNRSTHGGNVKINDYVIVPALACDGTSMIQIGVFAHEFGHAFRLPDLYDTSNATVGGVGNWDLMATGSWGGNDVSPESPTYMSAWSLEQMGWLDPIPITADALRVTVPDIALRSVAYKYVIKKGPKGDEEVYYLISYRGGAGSDSKLPASGLLVERIDDEAVDGGLPNNQVNVTQGKFGVRVIEADGNNHLVVPGGDIRVAQGDVFPVSGPVKGFDSSTSPAAEAGLAICNAKVTVDHAGVTVDLLYQRVCSDLVP